MDVVGILSPSHEYSHAGAVVGDADEREPTRRRHHLDVARAGVERVLDQLLDHAAGTLDHLAGGDAVDGLGAELADGHVGLPADISIDANS